MNTFCFRIISTTSTIIHLTRQNLSILKNQNCINFIARNNISIVTETIPSHSNLTTSQKNKVTKENIIAEGESIARRITKNNPKQSTHGYLMLLISPPQIHKQYGGKHNITHETMIAMLFPTSTSNSNTTTTHPLNRAHNTPATRCKHSNARFTTTITPRVATRGSTEPGNPFLIRSRGRTNTT